MQHNKLREEVKEYTDTSITWVHKSIVKKNVLNIWDDYCINKIGILYAKIMLTAAVSYILFKLILSYIV